MWRRTVAVIVCLVVVSVGVNVLLYRQTMQVCAAADAFATDAGPVAEARQELREGVEEFNRSAEAIQEAAAPIGVATEEVAAILEGVIIPEAIRRNLLSEVERISEGNARVERASRAAVRVTNGLSRSVREIDDGVVAARDALDLGWLVWCDG